ncbi:DUF1657 domain-containing protein [Numidum massiliense]|uniref:DUF1657 domain-containing protein n=1 Tax=Numidum massiliense TaxID=1522315 RepID=UPI0006D5AF08|nr:DUF1657 domain-containing protein [Numidum massiliense]
MTVGTKMQQMIASAESVAASLKTFALDTQNQNAKQMFQNLAQNMDMVVNQLNTRLNEIQEEEPQYKQM